MMLAKLKGWGTGIVTSSFWLLRMVVELLLVLECCAVKENLVVHLQKELTSTDFEFTSDSYCKYESIHLVPGGFR